MAVKEQPKTFTASDGSEWSTKKEAERHDAVVVANRELEDAKRKFCRAVLATQKTADGEQFDSMRNDNYWSVPWYGCMELVRLDTLWYWTQRFEIDSDSQVTIVVPVRDAPGQGYGREEKIIRYRVCDLYANEQAARKELIRRMKQSLEEQAKRIKQIEDRG